MTSEKSPQTNSFSNDIPLSILPPIDLSQRGAMWHPRTPPKLFGRPYLHRTKIQDIFKTNTMENDIDSCNIMEEYFNTYLNNNLDTDQYFLRQLSCPIMPGESGVDWSNMLFSDVREWQYAKDPLEYMKRLAKFAMKMHYSAEFNTKGYMPRRIFIKYARLFTQIKKHILDT